METFQDSIMADTVTPTNYPSVNNTPPRGNACVSSLKQAETTALPHSPSSPFAEILHVGLQQVQPCSRKKSTTNHNFASAVNAGRQFQREERYDDASTLFQVGMIHSYSQHHDPLKALQAFELCLQMSRACLGDDHPSIARVLYEIGVINESMSDPEEALAHFSEAIAILLSNSMDTHLKTLWMSLSRVQVLLGQTDDAQSSFNEAEKL
jgi:tetratricopeptide (TPR) repeat protein